MKIQYWLKNGKRESSWTSEKYILKTDEEKIFAFNDALAWTCNKMGVSPFLEMDRIGREYLYVYFEDIEFVKSIHRSYNNKDIVPLDFTGVLVKRETPDFSKKGKFNFVG